MRLPIGLVVGVVDLRRDEQVLTRDARCLERRPDLGLVAVHLSGVDMTVPDLEGAAHRVVRVLGRDLVGAEPRTGMGDPVGSVRVGIGDEAGAGPAGSGVFIGESSWSFPV